MTSLDFRPARALAAGILVTLAALPVHASEQLELMPDFAETLPALLVAFVVVTLLLDPLIFQPLLKVMDEREERIEGARRRADQVQEQAEEALNRYEDSIRAAYDQAAVERRRRTDTAREELARLTSQAKHEAEHEADRAREELSASVEEARDSLREGASDLATLAAERILGRSLAE